jgi:hypothetical protein
MTTQIRTSAKRQLKPATLAVMEQCLARQNDASTSMINAVFENSHALAEVKQSVDTHGPSGADDMAEALGMDPRQRGRLLLIAKHITREEFDLITSEANKEGRLFTATHLYQLARLTTKTDRKKAWNRWKSQSMTTDEFTKHIQSLLEDEEGEDTGPTEKSPIQLVNSAKKAFSKAEESCAELIALDFHVVADSEKQKDQDAFDSFRVELSNLHESIAGLLERVDQVAGGSDDSEEDVSANTGSPLDVLDSLDEEEEASEGEEATEPDSVAAPKKKAAKKKAPKKKAPKKAPKKKAAGVASTKGVVNRAPKKKAVKKKPSPKAKPPGFDPGTGGVASAASQNSAGPGSRRRRGTAS